MEGLNRIRERVVAAAGRVGRDPGEVRLVAVTKTASPESIREAYDAGHRDFGENRARRLARGASLLPDARWHMIGRLQGNKVKIVRPVAWLLHSLDRAELAGYWARGEGPAPPVLIQVNTGGDPRKAGVAPTDAGDLLERALEAGLDVRGLMTMPPMAGSPEDSRPAFRALAELRERLSDGHPGLRELSMGMTDDFEVAVEEGATVLRVGRAIFGPSEEDHRG